TPTSAYTQWYLVRVIGPSEFDSQRPADQPSVDPTLGLYRYVEQRLQAHQAQLTCPSELEVVAGDPAEEIVRLANIHQADLIVIGNRGLTGVNRILQGSVSSQVVGDAHCSVMVVKP
ncbi:MAG: universal stress protein, partial [Anaerolineae bacterium]|nr:universal stress protein [Anaerolineae bacterium]